MSENKLSGTSLALLFLPYLAVCLPYLLSPTYPDGDSGTFHVNSFSSFANSFKQDGKFPEVYWVSGGSRTFLTHSSYFQFTWHRWLGYALYCLLPLSTVFAYKLMYLLGVSFTALGWWLVLLRWFKNPLIATLGAHMILMGGTGITIHQEQALATMHLIPWFVLALQQLKDRPNLLLTSAAIIGLGLSTHHPQLQLVAMGIILLFLMPSFDFSKSRSILSLGLLILGALPSALLFFNLDSIASPMRRTDLFFPGTWTEYLALNQQQLSSALPEYLKQYLFPIFHGGAGLASDRSSFFVGRLAILLALIGAFTGKRRALVALTCGLVFLTLTLGIHSPINLVRLLFTLHFPMMSSFRQWFHFFPMLNMSISVLSCLGALFLLQFPSTAPKKLALLLSLILLQLVDLSTYDLQFLKTFGVNPPTPHWNVQVFSLKNEGPALLFIDKHRARMQEDLVTVNKALTAQDTKMKLLGTSLKNQQIHIRILARERGKFVVPLNYDAHWRVDVDDSPIAIERAHQALSAVWLEKGPHHIRFTPEPDLYGWIAGVNLLLYLGIFVSLNLVGAPLHCVP